MKARAHGRRYDATPWFFLAPFLAIFGVFLAWPLARSLVLAFQQTFGPEHTLWVGLKNFQFLLTDPLFWKAVRNTVVFTLGSLFIQLPVALGLALLLNNRAVRGRALLRLVFFAPSLVGLSFTGLLFVPILEKRTGLLNSVLHAVWPAWNPEFAWLQEYLMSSFVLAALWIYAGFNMVYFLAALQNVSRDLLDAASIDGCGPWQRFRHVTLPQIRPVAGFVTLLSVIGSMQMFELAYILIGFSGGSDAAGPENSGLTIVLYLYQTGFLTGDLGYASAIGWVLAAGLMAIAIVQRRLMTRLGEE